MERPRDVFEEIVALRVSVEHLHSDMADVKHDIRRLDDRVFQVTLLQLGTLAATLASIAASVLAALLS
ncbi:MAG TPA: hypothetical protein VKB64_07895 [Gaiellaceae bacterium]|nr:hypothetical protein [Gaiellaceae bacterium]